MKTKTINTGKATILVVDLPEYIKSKVIYTPYPDGMYWFTDCDSMRSFKAKLPEGNWKLLGFESNINEEKAFEIFKAPMFSLFEFYKLLKSNGIVTVNPYGSPDGKAWKDNIEQWQQTQQELWTNPVILLKQD